MPISLVTREEMEIEAGPNWDDNLGGSPIYAANDPNLAALTDEERRQLFETELIVISICRASATTASTRVASAACPAGAIYKRGEDGIVLVSQDNCQGWRMCVSGCPYKKVYFNWATGKSEKCILCYPRLETRQAPACMHSCVGRIRYLGVLLYDADRIEEVAKRPDAELVEAQRRPDSRSFDPEVQREAAANGLDAKVIESAQTLPGVQAM